MQKLIKISLIVSLIANVLAVLTIYNNHKSSLIIRRGISKFVYGNTKFVSIQGHFIPDSYIAANEFQVVDITCERNGNPVFCTHTSFEVGKGLAFSPFIYRSIVTKWTNEIVITKHETKCVEEYWIINLIEKVVILESKPLPPENRHADCAGITLETKRAHIGDWSEAKLLL